MAHLFSKTVIQEAIRNIEIPNIESKISILQDWLNMYNSGTLQKKSEKEFEGVYSESLFGTILGYNSASSIEYTREKEPRNESNGQKCDVGLGFYSPELSKTQAIVELKDAGTSLDRPQQRAGNLTPVQQAFKYKPLYNSKWVIVSNFFEIRLYTDTYQDFESFTLRDLINEKNNYENFHIFYVLFHAEKLIKKEGESETEKLLARVRMEEEKISKEFYKEYKTLRLELMRDIWKNNLQTQNADVIEKAQRIVDRIVFICFCEDRGLLPQNELTHRIKQAKEIDLSPWETLKIFFRSIDKGSEKLGIPDGYNGGLFRADESIDNLKISDSIVEKFINLGRYDFSEDGGQLSVEILGHIFEQSISDIEEIRTQIENRGKVEEEKETEKKVSKRKKDGIFYTPAYIVEYIVANSLGKYLGEHEENLQERYKLKEDITEKNYRKREIEAYTEYQKILQNVKVLDPACGSGAFLVRVFDFLLSENKRVANILYIEGDQIRLGDDEDVYRDILKNNIYGVDLNEESVEITKLSLWLKSAIKGKKLVTLDNNIKCGNSLIDDPAVAGDKAFEWNTEFAEIMVSGGFDVIVGNPPYVSSYGRQAQLTNKDDINYFIKNLKTFDSVKNRKNISFNTIMGFIEKGISLIKNDGTTGFIIDQAYLKVDVYTYSRKFLLENAQLNQLAIDIMFPGVIAETAILLFQKSRIHDYIVEVKKKYVEASSDMVFIGDLLQEDKIIYSSNSKILKKVESGSVILSKVADIFTGMQIIPEYFLSNDDSILNKSKWYKAVFSKNISRFSIAWPLEGQPGKYITYDNLLQDTIKKDLSERIKNGDNCRTPESLSIGSPDKEFRFFPPKLIMAQTISNANGKVKLQVAFDDYGYYGNVSIHLVKHEKETVLRSLLCILNSALITFYAKEKKFIMGAEEGSKKTPQIRKGDVELLPIPLNFLQKEGKFGDLSKIMMQLNNELHSMSESFLKNISAKYKIEKVTRKLEKWWELDFVDFIKELKVSIPLEEQEELMNYFEKRSMEVREIVSRIEATDKEIDEMVFELYGLNEEEKRIILESNGK